MSPLRYRVIVFKDSDRALGISCRMMLGHPAFARLPFAAWVGVMAAQVARGHVRFFIDDAERLVGFFGYALAAGPAAQAWTFKEIDIGDGRQGDCLIVNAWIAEDRAVGAAMREEMRRVAGTKTAIYYKRFYANGRVRAVRLPMRDSRIASRVLPRTSGGTQPDEANRS